MQIIATSPIASQSFKVVLAGHACAIALYQKSTGMYLDLSINGVSTIGGVLCRDRCLLVRQAYLGFVGDLCFADTQGVTDPVYSQLGTRYLLTYMTPDDVSAYA